MTVPSLSPLSDDGHSVAGRPVQVPPPPNFRPIRGTPRSVIIRSRAYARQRGSSVAKDSGLRYEAKVQEFLLTQYPEYIASPQIEFHDDSGKRFLVPDGLLRLQNRWVVIEIKIRHMPEAYWQLERNYAPVLQEATSKPIQCIEICKSFDPSMPSPVSPFLIENLDFWIHNPTTIAQFGVYIWSI